MEEKDLIRSRALSNCGVEVEGMLSSEKNDLGEGGVDKGNVQSVVEVKESMPSGISLEDELEIEDKVIGQNCERLTVDGGGMESLIKEEENGPPATSFQDDIEVGMSSVEQHDERSKNCDRLSDSGCFLIEGKVDARAVENVIEEENVPSGTSFQDGIELGMPSSEQHDRLLENSDRLLDDDCVLIEGEVDDVGMQSVIEEEENIPPSTSFRDDIELRTSTSEQYDRLSDGDTVSAERNANCRADTDDVVGDKEWPVDNKTADDDSGDKNWAAYANRRTNRINNYFSRNHDLHYGRRDDYHARQYSVYSFANRSRPNHVRNSWFRKQCFRTYPDDHYVQHSMQEQYGSTTLSRHLVCRDCPYVHYEARSDLYQGILGHNPYKKKKAERETRTKSSEQHESSQLVKNELQTSLTDIKFDDSGNYQAYASHEGRHKRKLEHSMISDVMADQNKRIRRLTMSPERPIKLVTCRKLLILDLNGLLVDVTEESYNNGKANTIIGKKAIFKRPFCDEFLKFCFDNFAVGIWSSRKKKNVDDLVDYLMGDAKDNLAFCWDQSICTFTGFRTIENKDKPLLLKEMKKVWNKEVPDLPWAKGVYSAFNTLLVDDSPYKALLNPPCTAVFPYPYHFANEDDCSLGPGGDIRIYIEGLITTSDVQSYVRRTYFGQRPITSRSSNWKYYEQIISKLERSAVAPAISYR